MNVLTEMNATSAAPSGVETDLARLRETVGRVVGSAFYGTLLQSMRESSLNTSVGHGGRGEEVFAAQLHGLWAERLGTTTRGGLTDALYESLAQQQRLVSRAGAQGAGDTDAQLADGGKRK